MTNLRMPKAFKSIRTTANPDVRQLMAPPTSQPAQVYDAFKSDEPAQELTQIANRIDTSWLAWAAKTYCISPNLEDYVVKSMPICPSGIPNRNGIGFPLAELLRYQPPPVARQTYRAWTGCPVHYEHRNEDHTKALGVIFDASLRPIRTHGKGKVWMVHGLMGVDKTKYPELAARIVSGDLNTGSMGALADSFSCSVCGSEVDDNHVLGCGHVQGPKSVNWRMVQHAGQSKIAFLNAHSLTPLEYSFVEDPAWVTCLSDGTL